MSQQKLLSIVGKIAVCFAFLPSVALADQQYDVTITNIAAEQSITPRLIVTHRSSISLFTLGAEATSQLQSLAEEGNTTPFESLLGALSEVNDTEIGAGLLASGASQTVRISARNNNVISLAAMIIPTNDTFVGLRNASLPHSGSVTYFVEAYDAGTEVNDELCSSIPGPSYMECGGAGGGAQVGGGEGFVHVSRGISGIGDFNASARDWKNPVAQVTITRVGGHHNWGN